MAVIIPTVRNLRIGVLKVEWSGIEAGDDCLWVSLAGYTDKTVHISGTATTFVLQGSNESGGANPVTVKDTNETAITATGIYTIVQSPISIRPLLTAGAGVTVTLNCRS